MSSIAYLFWGLLLAIVVFGVLYDKLFPNRVKFKDTEHIKSTNQQLNENASLNNKSTNEISGTFLP
ncbi:uncharacterized membrane protein YciS (DUF1049 family) [Neobacillus niacini]|jgi:uncharacterized membrane protein YciS (DUF1049 family)|uniref:hypothetical protein n=1 Tax=Neobacillus niacini TaxID=86668 RepID=UPI002783FF52|nr:hypothetical protein [Neobacillus niacini]MDQ1002075.1 uncharacterized membrane protein YciS (DUF1049 family) [Neobacillus niacini]